MAQSVSNFLAFCAVLIRKLNILNSASEKMKKDGEASKQFQNILVDSDPRTYSHRYTRPGTCTNTFTRAGHVCAAKYATHTHTHTHTPNFHGKQANVKTFQICISPYIILFKITLFHRPNIFKIFFRYLIDTYISTVKLHIIFYRILQGFSTT